MTEIGRHDDVYRSTPLEQKLAWFQNVPGLSAVEPARQFMSGAAALYTDSDAQVRATLRSLGADWSGDAATNAGATLQRAADWSQDAGASHGAGGQTVEGYGRSFESLRGQVHWDDPWAWGWNDTASAVASVATLSPAPFLGNLTADYFTTAQQNRTNDATAVAALRAHEDQTRTAVNSFPSIQPAGIDPQPGLGANPALGSRPTPLVATADDAPVGAAAAGAGPVPVGAGPGPVVAGADGGASGAGAGGPGGTGPGAIIPGIGPGAASSGGAGAASGQPGRPGGVTPGVIGGAAPGGVGGATPGRASGATPGRAGGATPGRAGGATPGGIGDLDPDGRIGSRGGGAIQGGTAGAVPGSDPRLRGGADAPGGAVGAREGGAVRLPPGADAAAGRFGVGAPGPAGGWRDVVARPPAEPGLISRGPAAGPEFAARLPSGAGMSGTAVEGAGMPFVGGMGVGAGAQSTEHRSTYWVRSAEPFDVPLPPHGEGVLHGGNA